MKVFDITQPKDNWERGYAKLAYECEGLRQVGTKKIKVTTDSINICRSCGIVNNSGWNCERCDGLAQMYEDSYREDS